MIEIEGVTIHAKSVQIVTGDGSVMLALKDKQGDNSYVFLPEDTAEILLLQLLSWVEHRP